VEQTSLHKSFRTLIDPRINRRKLHSLLDIIILSILAVLCGADTYEEMELFGKENYCFLKQFLSLKNGIPSQDTVNRVFQRINPRRFERCFIMRAQGLKDGHILGRVIAIDGKTVRGSKDTFHHKSPLHSVHAWSVGNGICLARMECGEKTGEITTVPQVPELLEKKGSVITVDAVGTQRETARKTVENGGDCILAVKGSQGRLEEEIHAACKRNSSVPDTGSVEKGHGRIETRRCEVFEKGLTADFENRWEKLTAVIKIASIREFGDKTETRERFYIGSLNPDNSFNRYIRDRRAVENNPHWSLTRSFVKMNSERGPGTPLKFCHSQKNCS
jgi:hypothetical protein